MHSPLELRQRSRVTVALRDGQAEVVVTEERIRREFGRLLIMPDGGVELMLREERISEIEMGVRVARVARDRLLEPWLRLLVIAARLIKQAHVVVRFARQRVDLQR